MAHARSYAQPKKHGKQMYGSGGTRAGHSLVWDLLRSIFLNTHGSRVAMEPCARSTRYIPAAQRGTSLLRNAVPIVATALLVVLAYIPSLIARLADPPFAPLAVRLPYESVILAGNLAAGILPAPIGSFNL
ncbi:MAG: hypothetical protein OSA11_00925 [Candidatus Nanopelagicales bacterium]|nr:hypothetical protein [Candidatus Nanopelagicales bacterium]